MRIGAIIQARMRSRRLPGKVLRRVRDRPVLRYLLERLQQCDGLDGVTVATSIDPSDEPIQNFCLEFGVSCCRGPLDDGDIVAEAPVPMSGGMGLHELRACTTDVCIELVRSALRSTHATSSSRCSP